MHASVDSAGAEPTAMSEAARRQATASLLSDTGRGCQRRRLVAIGRSAYLRVRGAYGTARYTPRSMRAEAGRQVRGPELGWHFPGGKSAVHAPLGAPRKVQKQVQKRDSPERGLR